MKIIDIIETIEDFAPFHETEEWDNSGWQVMIDDEESSKVLVALDVNDNTVEQAIQAGCNLIISHHPIFFSPIKIIKPS